MEKSPKLKIDYLLPALDLGGTEKHVIRLASALKGRGHETEIVCVFREGVLSEEAQKEGLPLTCLRARQAWRPGALFRIFNWIRSRRVDVLHAYLFGFHFFAGCPARLLGVPVILSSRRDVDLPQKRRHHWLENMGNLFVDRVICCSRAVEEWVRQREKIPSEKILTIYNGVDLKQFEAAGTGPGIRRELGIPEKAPLIGTVANFSFKKGYPYLLEAVRLILEKRPDAWFLFVGSGPFEKEMKEKAREISPSQQIIFTGFRHDVPALLGAMDLFVFASLWEGLPNVVLEAMAMAKPVVSTAVGGVPEVIGSGHDGVLVPPKDGRALSEAILSLLGDSKKAHEMGARAQEKIRKDYPLERMVEEYEDLYLSLWREKKAGAASFPS